MKKKTQTLKNVKRLSVFLIFCLLMADVMAVAPLALGAPHVTYDDTNISDVEEVVEIEEEYDDGDAQELAAIIWDGQATISGVITNLETDQGAAGVTVELRSDEHETFSARTNRSGRFTLNIALAPEQGENEDEDAFLTQSDLQEFLATAELVASGGGFMTRRIGPTQIINGIAEEDETTFSVDFEMLQGANVPPGMRVVTGVVNFYDDVQSNQAVVVNGNTVMTNSSGRFIAQVSTELEYVTIEASTTTVIPDDMNNPDGSSHTQNVTSGQIIAFVGNDDLYIQDVNMHLVGAVVTDETRTPQIHEITTAQQLTAFLLGDLGDNHDTFILMNDITALGRNNVLQTGNLPGGGGGTNSLVQWHMGRPAINGEPFTGQFIGNPVDDGNGGTRAPIIDNLRLRPRTASSADTPGSHLAHPDNILGLNDFGFIRVLGDGAVISNVTFTNAYLYDGGRGTGSQLEAATSSPNHTTIAHRENFGTQNDRVLAARAGGQGQIAGNADAGTGRLNLHTHRGIVAGRVVGNANVTITDVNVGNPITGPLGHTDRVTMGGQAINNVSASRHRGIWRARMSGFIATVEPGANVNITNANVSVRTFQQALGSENEQAGLIATNHGNLNLNNINIASEAVESNWGNIEHANHTWFTGGLVAHNTGTIHFVGRADGNNIHHRTIREESTAGFSTNTGGGDNNNRGFFNDAGRLIGRSTGAVNVSNVNLTGDIFGTREVGGAIGIATAPVTLTNVHSSGQVGGTLSSFHSDGRNNQATRPQNGGGLVGRSTALLYFTNVSVDGNIFGSRNTNRTGGASNNLNTQGTGGFVAHAQSVIINDSEFRGGTINDTGHGGHMGGFIGRTTGAVAITNSHVNGGTMQNGGTASRNWPAGRGGMIGFGTATSTIRIEGSTNRMPANTSRGFVGGFVGRMQGRNITIRDSTNYAAVSTHTLTTVGIDLLGQWRAAGGFIGQTDNSNVLITNSYNRGNVTGNPRRRGLGGFVGSAFGASNTVTLEGVENHGNITRGNNLHGNSGGLLGWMRGSVVITDSSNHGTISNHSGGGGGTTANTTAGLVSRVDRHLTVTNSTNYGNVSNTQNATHRVGGIAGYVRGRITMTDVTNYGNVTSNISSAGRRNSALSSLGGIIARSDMGGIVAAQRQSVLTNVENHGNVGTGANAETSNHSAGGIIGRTINRGSNNYRLEGVINHGDIRGRNYVGGVIGFNDSPNVRIEDAANHGAINSFWGATDARGHIGGLVGRTGRATLHINRSFNTGEVRTLSTSGHAALTTASAAGLVGHRSAGNVIINESFNAGAVMGVDRNTGGLVGFSRGIGGLTIRNAYNIGTITSRTGGSGAALTRRQRSGNGILGFRAGGPVVIENAYNAGRTQGRPIYGSPAANPNAAIGTYMTFRNVFFDTSVHTGTLQTIGRGTINGVPTDLLNRGILPGLTGDLWLSGLRIVGDEAPYLNTYPYLAWQTDGELEEQFMISVREQATGYSFSDLEGTGTRTGEFVIPAAYVERTKYFAPYPSAQAVHLEPVTQETSTTTITETGPRSLGLVSENWVVGFDIEDRTGVAVMAVDEITGETIYWAEFASSNEISPPIAGIVIVSNVPASGIDLDITAMGYEDTTYLITLEAYEASPTGVIRILMRRVDIPYVRVEIRHQAGTEENPTSNITPDSTLAHERIDPEPFGPYPQTPLVNPAPRHFMLNDVQWRDILHANAPNFSNVPHMLGIEHFHHISENPSMTDPHIVHLYIEDLRLPNKILNVVWFEEWDAPAENDETPRRVNIVRTGSESSTQIPGAHITPTVRQPEGLSSAPNTSVNTTSVAAHQWNIVSVLSETQVRVGAAGFRTSEYLTIGDLLEYSEPANDDVESVMLNTITIDLERLIRLNVTVVDSIDYNDNGGIILGTAPTSQVLLEFVDGLTNVEARTLTRNSSNTFTVTGVTGEELRASAPGYAVAFHVIDYLEDVTTRHAVITGANAFTGSTGNIIMVLTPLEDIERTVIFDYYPDASYGTVEARIDGELIDNVVPEMRSLSLNYLPGFTLDVIENEGEFQHWQSPAFPNEVFTTEALMALNMPDGVTVFTAVFAEPLPPALITYEVVDEEGGELSATFEGDYLPTNSKVPADSTVVFTATPDAGYEVLEWRVNGVPYLPDSLELEIATPAETLSDILTDISDMPNILEWVREIQEDAAAPTDDTTVSNQPTVELNGLVLTASEIFEDLHVTVEYTPIILAYDFDFGEGFNTYGTSGEVGFMETPVAPEEIPINVGYRFDGWSPAVGPIAVDTTFNAIWTPTTVDFVFDWDWNNETIPRTEGYNYLPTAPAFSAAPHRPGMHVVAWEPAMHRITDYDNVTVFTAQWADNDIVRVSFDPAGGILEEGTDVYREFPYGLTVADTDEGMPTDPTREGGYTFVGWFIEGDDTRPFNEDVVVNDPIRVVAAWEEIFVTYLFDFDPDDEFEFVGNDAEFYNRTDTIRYGATPEEPTDIPINVGYRFNGWEPVVGPMTADTVFRAQWERTYVDYIFDWMVDDGIVPQEVTGTIAYNGIPTPPTNVPNHPGQFFSAWEPTVGRITNTDAPTRFEAQWTDNDLARVNFFPEGGVLIGENYRELAEGLYLGALMPMDPTRSGGFIFDGWFIDGDENQPFTAQTPLTPGATNVYARWIEVFVPYEFNFGETFDTYNTEGEIRYNTAPTPPTDIPINVGYRFDGWNPAVGPITEATTFYAEWIPTNVTYRFDWDYDGQFRDGQVGFNGFATPPTDSPNRPGYHVTGWSLTRGGAPVDVATTRINDHTARTVFFAIWEANRTIDVIFDLNGGHIDGDEQNVTVSINEGQSVGAARMPEHPELVDYDFMGWYIEGDENRPFGPDLAVTDDLVDGLDQLLVVARWMRVSRDATIEATHVRAMTNTVLDDIEEWLIDASNLVAQTITTHYGQAAITADVTDEVDIAIYDLAGNETELNVSTGGQYLVTFTLPTSVSGTDSDKEISIIVTLIPRTR